MLFPILWPSNLPAVVAQPDERHANRTASVQSGMTDTEHTTFGSNEEEAFDLIMIFNIILGTGVR